MNLSGPYFVSVYALPGFLTSLCVLALGLFSLYRGRGSRESFLFFLTTLSITLWLQAFSWMYCSVRYETAIEWAKLAYLGVPFIPSVIYHFSMVVLRIEGRRSLAIAAAWIASTFFVSVNISGSALIEGLHHYSWGYYPRYGTLCVPYLLFFFGMMFITMKEYWAQVRETEPGSLAHHRARAVLFAFSIAYLGSVDYLAKFGIAVYPFGYIPVFIFLILALRAMWIYHLVEITPAFAANEIIQNMKDALIVCDREGRVCIFNGSASTLLEADANKSKGAYLNALIKLKESPDRFWNDVFKDGPTQDIEIQVLSKLGQERDWNFSKSVLRGKDRSVEGYVIMIRDISDRKKNERSLKSLNEALEKRVAQRTEELERKIKELGKLNEIMMGREEKILELKDELKELKLKSTVGQRLRTV